MPAVFEELIPGMKEEYVDYFRNDAPKWLVISGGLDCTPSEVYDQISKSYIYVASDIYGRQLYHLNLSE